MGRQQFNELVNKDESADQECEATSDGGSAVLWLVVRQILDSMLRLCGGVQARSFSRDGSDFGSLFYRKYGCGQR
jgi:hypothetical protein